MGTGPPRKVHSACGRGDEGTSPPEMRRLFRWVLGVIPRRRLTRTFEMNSGATGADAGVGLGTAILGIATGVEGMRQLFGALRWDCVLLNLGRV